MKNFVHDLQVRQARFVAGLSYQQLAFLERGPLRWALVHAIPVVLPRKFKKSVGSDIDGVLELQLLCPDGAPPDRIQLAMRNGRCRGSLNGSARPDATATMHISDLIRLATGSAEGGWLAHDGRIQLSGDPFLFVRFPAAFGLRTRPLYAEHRGPTLIP